MMKLQMAIAVASLLAVTPPALAQAARLQSSIIHPIGYHGHVAGATIGFWDDQNPPRVATARCAPTCSPAPRVIAENELAAWFRTRLAE